MVGGELLSPESEGASRPESADSDLRIVECLSCKHQAYIFRLSCFLVGGSVRLSEVVLLAGPVSSR